jgi:AcrR family transcriptional regulator
MTTRRETILAAALEAFAEQGVEGTTIAEVRRRSGASVGSIYHHFGDKEGLADALYLDGLRRYQQGFLDVLARHADAERGVKALVRHHLRWVAANPDLARYLLRRREVDDEAVNAELRRASTDWLAHQRQAGRLRPLPSDLTLVLLIGGAQEFCRLWLAGRAQTSIERAERPLAEAAWRALRA